MPAQRAGQLYTRAGGQGRRGVLLLHGLVGTGDVFSVAADALAGRRRVAVPDLLGFGRSINNTVTDFGTDAHLAALETVIDEALGDRPLLIGAHSMGSTLALRLGNRVEWIVCIGAPIWPDPATAVGEVGPMARTLLVDERIAKHLCQYNCRHRWLSGWIAAAVAPRWPIPIARQASLHTWPAYRQTLEHQVLDVDWSDLLTLLGTQHAYITLAWGNRDAVGDPAYTRSLIEDLGQINVEIIPDADHTAPVSQHQLLVNRLNAEAR
jgi:pimeloyl-ACP methyl ester carboxylesterase